MAKYKSRATRLQEALDEIRGGMEEIEGLKQEIEDWRTGMEGTNLENTEKYSQLQECEDALDTAYNDIESAVCEAEGITFPGMY